MKYTVNLKQELDGNPDINFKEINMRLLAVAQMQTVCEVFMAEIEDILNEQKKFKYDIKRQHKKIVDMIHKQYADIYRIWNMEQLSDFVEDNKQLQKFIRLWVGLEKDMSIYMREIIDNGEPYKMIINPIGDISLFNKDGWAIQIPKAIANGIAIVRTLYDEAKDATKPTLVDVDISIKRPEEKDKAQC